MSTLSRRERECGHVLGGISAASAGLGLPLLAAVPKSSGDGIYLYSLCSECSLNHGCGDAKLRAEDLFPECEVVGSLP